MFVLDAARGTKRVCQNCSSRYYDLGRESPVCPKCGTVYVEPPRALPTYRARRQRVVAPVRAVEADAPVMDIGSAEVANVDAEDEDGDKETAEPEVEDADKTE